MLNQLDDVNFLLNGKHGLKYAGASLEALRDIAHAHGNKKLQEFAFVLNKYQEGKFGNKKKLRKIG
jgi:26S proteasome regulatory subunit N6